MTTARHKTLTVSIKTKMLKIQFTQTCIFNFNGLAVCVNKGGKWCTSAPQLLAFLEPDSTCEWP